MSRLPPRAVLDRLGVDAGNRSLRADGPRQHGQQHGHMYASHAARTALGVGQMLLGQPPEHAIIPRGTASHMHLVVSPAWPRNLLRPG